MARFYVTRGKQETQLNTPGVDIGQWETITNKEQLTKLQYDLPLVDDCLDISRDDISLPSPWANIILFDAMINNTDKGFGSLQNKALAEWRAILYLIIMRDLLPFKLQFESLSLTNITSASEAEKQFFNRMYRLKPLNGIFSHSWEEIVFIKIDNIPIGIISDSNLVCSRYQYEENSATKTLIKHGLMNQKYEWIDPTENIKNDIVLSVFVANWLKSINNYLSLHNDSNAVTSRKLSDLLGNFRNDLLANNFNKKYAEDIQFISFAPRLSTEAENALDLIKSIQPETININLPEITQEIEINTTNNSNVYVLDYLSETFRKIYDVYPSSCELPTGGKMIGKSDIFMDAMTLMNITHTAPVSVDGQYIIEKEEEKYQIILPIKEGIFEYISSEEIRDNIRVQHDDDGIDIIISFRNKNNNYNQLKKKYYYSDCQFIPHSIPNEIAIWPYTKFRDENDPGETIWNEYYVYSNYVQMDVSPKTFEYQVKYDGILWDSIQKCNWKKFLSGAFPASPKVYRLDRIPTYIAVTCQEFGVQKNYGVLFLKKPEIYDVNKNKKCFIGVDFGTTSTAIFYKEDSVNAVEKFVSFAVREESHNKSVDDIFRNDKYIVSNITASLESEFVSDKYPHGRRAYPSLIEHKETGNESFLLYDESFKWGNIIYDQLDSTGNQNNDIMRNMKWGMDANSKKAIESYLGQVIKMTAYVLARNGFGNLTWRFSYPTSLSTRMFSSFKDRTRAIVENLRKLNLHSTLDPECSYFPESIVSAKFYKDTDHYICMDIGGGSTDVSIWKGAYEGESVRNIIQFSIGVASRKIFLQAFTNLLLSSDNNDSRNDYQRIFKDELERGDIKSHSVTEEIQRIRELKKQGTLKKNEYLDFIYCIEPGIQIVGNIMKEKVAQTNPENNFKFYKVLISGLWGLLYYTALSIEGIKEHFSSNSDQYIYLNFAGTGSKMYSWISGEYGETMQQAFSNLINQYVYGDPHAGKIRVVFKYQEDELKTEAACGLLKIDAKEAQSSTANIFLRNCGTTFISQEDSGLADDLIVSKEVNVCENKYIKSFFSADNDERISAIQINFNSEDTSDPFIQFIDSLNSNFFETSGEKINLSLIDSAKMNKKIKEVLEENKKNHTIASAFIIKLEALIEYLLEW